jgi:predicted transcriptional regulator
MEELVAELTQGLNKIAAKYEELLDTSQIEHIVQVLEEGFIDNVEGNAYEVTDDLGMFTLEGNLALQTLLQDFIDQAIDLADEQGIDDAADRREALRSDDLAEILGEDIWE